MKRLFTKTLLIVGLVFLTYLLLFFLPSKSTLVYASILDKHQLLQRAGSPKIVFIGGSSLALGLDSALIQTKTGLPVVNMGLNGGLGLRYMLEEVKPDIGPGDLIVVSPEYEHWVGSLLEGGLNLLWVMQIRPDFIGFISSPAQVKVLLESLPEFMQEKFLELLPSKPDPIYNRMAFNQYGDFVNHLKLAAPNHLDGVKRLQDEPYNRQTMEVIKTFGAFAKLRGAHVVYMFPPLAQTQFAFKDNAATIRQLDDQVKNIPQITVSGAPTDFVFPDSMFFDTVYHLRAEGRQKRSERIAASLLQVLHNSQNLASTP